MKLYLKSLLPQLNNFSLSLNKKSILIDKPWTVIDEDKEIQKIIFRKNKDLILSKNGKVTIGKWDYFAEARSLLIDRVTDKILCNEAFINEGILVLKLDGTENKFFILVNEKLVPNLDAVSYLRELRNKRLNIFDVPLSNGKLLEVKRKEEYADNIPEVGNRVTIESEQIEDGKYKSANENKYFIIIKSRIARVIHEKYYFTTNGRRICVHQHDDSKIKKGDQLFLDEENPSNGYLLLSKKKRIQVKNGIISEIQVKAPLLGWI